MRKILTIFLTIILLLATVMTPVSAKTAEELNNEIKQKQEELKKLEDQLKKAEDTLKSSISKKNSSLSEIEAIKLELTEVESQLEINAITKAKVEEQIKLKQLEKEDLESKQNKEITDAYIAWRTVDYASAFISGEDIVKTLVYQEYLAETSRQHILGLSTELNSLQLENASYEEQIANLEKEKVAFEEKKKLLEAQIANLNSSIASSSNSTNGIRTQIGTVQQKIDQLTEEQKAIESQDDALTGGNTNGGQQEIVAGQLYFSGTGRDLYQGHGVGMSQFGAYGAAKNGWSAEKIISFYYSQTKIEERAGSINVQGYGTMDLNDYVAGLGEVPDKACGTAEQAAAQPDKYVNDNPNSIWDCWPEEAIKAQVIAARSYAASYGGTICTTASCQVYKGGDAKRWAANETLNKVIISTGSTHNGQIIRALYSSDNNQGYGTADNDTVWSNFSGVGTPYSYLRAVNDNSFAATYTYTHWAWRTNSYSIAQIDQFFSWAANNYNTGGSNSFLRGIKNQVGTVNNLGFIRDSSNRVKQVQVYGSNGTTVMAGWLFKAVWNSWVANVKPSGETDYIYSLTFFLKTG